MEKTPSRNLLGVALSYKGKPTKTEFNTILFYFKQAVGLLIGIALGGLKQTGIITMAGFFVQMSIISYLYSHLYLEFDEEEIEHTAVFTESIAQSFFAFMLSWILAFSYLDFQI